MKSLLSIIFGSALLLSLSACQEDEPTPEPGTTPDDSTEEPLPEPEPEPEPDDPSINLSADEMANCYIVQEPGQYRLLADNQFNLCEGLPVPTPIFPTGAKLVWQTEPSLLADIELKDVEGMPYIYFTVNKAEGNALIAAVDDKDRILWSWHIWMPEIEVNSLTADTGYEIMNLNLGALNNQPGDVKSYGMLYQWGRKDPFAAAGTLTGTTSTISAPLFDIEGHQVLLTNSSWTDTDCNTIEYSISNPTVVLSNYSQFSRSRDWLAAELSDNSLWGNPQGDYRDPDTNTYPNKGRKTCYDPSPAGWRVAPADAFRNFTSTGGYAWEFTSFNIADINNDGKLDINDYNYGWLFAISPSESLYFPAAARFDGSYAMLMGSMSGLWGSYWSNAPYSDIAGGAFCNLSFQVKDQAGREVITISPSGGGSRADAYSVRCVRDK